eukprot:4506625-Alexandrium_andersonii.AAC.1
MSRSTVAVWHRRNGNRAQSAQEPDFFSFRCQVVADPSDPSPLVPRRRVYCPFGSPIGPLSAPG